MSTAQPNWLTLEVTPFSVGGFSCLWLVAAATYGVGDVMTTIAIVYFTPTVIEEKADREYDTVFVPVGVHKVVPAPSAEIYAPVWELP